MQKLTDLRALMPVNPVIIPRIITNKDLDNYPGFKPTFNWSASQISSFEDCPRAWFFDKIEKRPRKEQIATFFGSLFHSFRESFFHTGIVPCGQSITPQLLAKTVNDMNRAGLVKLDVFHEADVLLRDAVKLAKLGLIHLPMGQMFADKKHIERSIDIKTEVGKVRGYVDFYLPDQGAVGYWPRERTWWPTLGVPLVGDHKSTASKKYIKTIDELMHKDPQPAIYGMDALQQTGSKEVDFLWHYNVKKGKKQAIPVRFRMSKQHIEDRFGKTEAVAKKMLQIFESGGIVAADVEPKLSACDNYGGCPHRDYCVLTNQQKLGALTMSSQEFNNMLDGQIDQNAQSVQQNPAMAQMQGAMNPQFNMTAPVIVNNGQTQNGQMQQQPQNGQMQQQPQNGQMQQQQPQTGQMQQQQPQTGQMQQQQQQHQQQQHQQQQQQRQQEPQNNFGPSAAPAMTPAANTQLQMSEQVPPNTLPTESSVVQNNQTQTLQQMGAQITPPDAPAVDLDVTIEELKEAGKTKKKLSAKASAERLEVATRIYCASCSARVHLDHTSLVEESVRFADELIAACK